MKANGENNRTDAATTKELELARGRPHRGREIKSCESAKTEYAGHFVRKPGSPMLLAGDDWAKTQAQNIAYAKTAN